MNINEIKDDHATYIFEKNKSSIGVSDDGTEYDHSFPTENGRVSYVYKEDGNYLVTLITESGISVARVLSFDLLSQWFYNPDAEYFENNISSIEVIEE
jgi:hypothetical protein